MRKHIVILVLLGFTGLAHAQEQKVIDKKFLELSAFLVASTVFDVETTFVAIHNGAHEANPLLKGFVKHGRAETYAVQLGADALLLFVAYEIKKSNNKDFQQTWWLLPTVAATGHTISGGLNLRYVW